MGTPSPYSLQSSSHNLKETYGRTELPRKDSRLGSTSRLRKRVRRSRFGLLAGPLICDGGNGGPSCASGNSGLQTPELTTRPRSHRSRFPLDSNSLLPFLRTPTLCTHRFPASEGSGVLPRDLPVPVGHRITQSVAASPRSSWSREEETMKN